MEFKKVSDLSFFTDEQKLWFMNYIIYKDGKVFNEKTGKYANRTLHGDGSRGYVVNLSIHLDGIRKQRQISLHKALADLFIRPMSEGETVVFLDGDKTNISIENLIYRLTNRQKKAEYSKCSVEMKGITEEGRVCTTCKDFKEWEEMSGNKKSSVCRECASKRGYEYQKRVGYWNKPVNFDTYSEQLKDDLPINVDGKIGFNCVKCGDVFLLTRGKVQNRIRVEFCIVPLICDKCSEEKDNEPK